MAGGKKKGKGAPKKGKAKNPSRTGEGRNVNFQENERHVEPMGSVQIAEQNPEIIESYRSRRGPAGISLRSRPSRENAAANFIEDTGEEVSMEVSNAVQLRAPPNELEVFPGPQDTEEELAPSEDEDLNVSSRSAEPVMSEPGVAMGTQSEEAVETGGQPSSSF